MGGRKFRVVVLCASDSGELRDRKIDTFLISFFMAQRCGQNLPIFG